MRGSIFAAVLLLTACDDGQSSRPASAVDDSAALPEVPPASPAPPAPEAPANAEPEFVTSRTHIDQVRQPNSLFDEAGKCMDNAQCAQAVQSLAAAYGVRPEDVQMATATLSTSQNGEGSYTTIRLPANYQYCRAEMTMVSIVPRDGDRGSLFLGQARPDGVYYETWTPVQRFGGGRSWVEAYMTVLGVRSDIAEREYASGRCVRGEPARAFFYCRGGGCISTADRGQTVDTSSPPGAGSNK